MTFAFWVQELTAAFWESAGDESFPRDLRPAIARSLPVSVVLLPDLDVTSIDSWLVGRGVICRLSAPDSSASPTGNRRLRACLVAYRDHGMIFLDATDPENEQRFSLAHELGHYLRHYWWPRRRASQRLGTPVLEVFDGARPAEAAERVHALLTRIPLDMHVHLMSHDRREPRSVPMAEREADQMAFELLAPSAHVLNAVSSEAPGDRRATAIELLLSYYGLPAKQANRYATLLVGGSTGSQSFVRRLGLVR